jgi:ferredoxin-type protein NapH
VRMHSVCGPVFHCYSCPLATFACPIGVLAQFSALHVLPLVAVGTLAAVGAVVGSFVCGWACPFGFLQDLLARIPTPKFSLPAWTGVFRYVVLVALVLAIPYWYGEGHELFFCRLCPAGTLEGAIPNTAQLVLSRQIGAELDATESETAAPDPTRKDAAPGEGAGQDIPWPSRTRTVILVAVLAAALVTWRPWCTLLCPLGAIYAVCNRFSMVFMRFHPDRCRECKVCRSLCRGGERPNSRVDGLRCVRCMECQQCQAVSIATVFNPGQRQPGAPGPEPVRLENPPPPSPLGGSS